MKGYFNEKSNPVSFK